MRYGFASPWSSPKDRGRNTVVRQVEAPDVRACLEHVASAGGTVTPGPSYDEGGGFWFGGFADPEGSPWWAVDARCP